MQQEMARSRPIDSKGKKGYKVLVLNEVDRLTKEAQHSLRRTMEKYSAACRLVLCCNNASRVRLLLTCLAFYTPC
jgi:replication factor C subunit 3/5